jgi:hypothetical protein
MLDGTRIIYKEKKKSKQATCQTITYQTGSCGKDFVRDSWKEVRTVFMVKSQDKQIFHGIP